MEKKKANSRYIEEIQINSIVNGNIPNKKYSATVNFVVLLIVI